MARHRFSLSSSSNMHSDSVSGKGSGNPWAHFQNDYTQALQKVKLVDGECMNQTPGPYTLPPIIGYKNHDITKVRAPAFTIGVKRPAYVADMETPGPIYETTGLTQYGKANAPKAKLKSRLPTTSVYTDKLGPGPGHYSPEKYINATHRRAPFATIKGRKQIKVFDESPAPTFDPEPVLGSRLPLKKSAPSATVKGKKYHMSVYSDSGPGPGSYNLGPVHQTMNRSPSAALGNKWSGRTVYTDNDTPGPNVYSPRADNFGPRAPKAFLGVRHSKCQAPYIIPEDTYSLVEF